MATAEYQRPWLYEDQESAIFSPERYALIEASTKSGKTVGCIVWLWEQAMQGLDGFNYWWVAPVYGQAKIAYTRLWNFLPQQIRALCHKSDSELKINLPNGTFIWFKTAEKPDNLYGEDVYACVIDEASRCREESWHAIRSTLTATRGPVRIIGNVKGRRNWAYRLARKAEAGEPNMSYAKLTAHDAIRAGILTEEEVADARRQLPEDVFNELYLAEPSDDAGNPFGGTHIKACIKPLSDSKALIWGWDLAKHVDWTVGIGLDRDGVTAAFHRFQKPWEETMTTILETTHGHALVDSTGVGDPIVEQLQRKGGSSKFEGYHFTQQSKQKLMEGLAVAVQQHKIGFPEGHIVNEMEEFEYEYTRTGVRYSAPEGMHDDCVCALALAVMAMGQPAGDMKEVKSVPSRMTGSSRGGDW